MSEVDRRARAEVVRLSDDRAAVTGTVQQINAVLEQLRRDGLPIKVSNPVPDGRPGVYLVTVRLAPIVARPIRQPAPRRQFWTRRRVGVAVGVGLVVLAAICWAVFLVVAWIAAHAVVVLGALVGLAVLAGLAGPRICQTVVTVSHRH